MKIDEIGDWSEVKLEIVKKYATAYSKLITATPEIRKHIYIDAFAGAGVHISKKTGAFVAGSPLNAAAIVPPFSEIHIVDLDRGRAQALHGLTAEYKHVTVYEGDANELLLKIFPRCRYEDYARGLCLLDPYKLAVDWNVLETAGHMRSIEVFYNLMIMDANMNVFLHREEDVRQDQIERMNKVWGDETWREAAYVKFPGLFKEEKEKAPNESVAEAFRKRLQQVAGFKFVPSPIPMRNRNGAVIYYLYFASPNKTGAAIVESIFNKFRTF
jgi:three-Cys-motif partner protein